MEKVDALGVRTATDTPNPGCPSLFRPLVSVGIPCLGGGLYVGVVFTGERPDFFDALLEVGARDAGVALYLCPVVVDRIDRVAEQGGDL